MVDRRSTAMSRWLVLLAVPALVRLLCLFELRRDPFFSLLVVDARTYHDTAVAMASGGWKMDGPFWQPPLYPLLLSWIYGLFRPSSMAVRLLQIVLGSVGCLLVYRLGRRLAGPRAGWIAWGIAAFCAPLVFFDLQLLGASLGTLLLLVALERATTWNEARRVRDLAAAGLACGLAAITVATSLLLIPVLAGWIGWRARGSDAPSARGARRDSTRGTRSAPWIAPALYLAAALIPVLAVTAMNLRASGRPVLVSYNAGVNFWIGNNADYDRAIAIRPGRAWRALMDEPVRAGVREPAETSSWFFRRSWHWIASHPADWARLLLRKTRLFLRGDELARNQEIYPFRSSSILLRVLLWIRGIAFPSGLLIPLGMAGLVLSLRARGLREAGGGLLAASFAAYAAGVIAFLVASRYRLPVLPILAVFAGVAIARGREIWRARRWPELLLPSAVCAAFLWFANAGLPAMPRAFHSDTYSDQGTAEYEAGRLDRAAEWYQRALELDPENAEAAHNLGAIRLQQNRPELAEPLFRRVLAAWPDDENALVNLGNAYLQRGEAYRAGRYYLDALRRNPQNPDASRNLGLAREAATRLEFERMAADPDGFLLSLDRLLAQEPGNDFLRDRLAALRAAREARPR